MPAIAKIRFTNVVFENGAKRYNDEIFDFDGHNGAILLENGGGKTVFIQTALQAIIPHIDMAERKIKDTLSLENAPAHIAIEWILNDQPRRYALTATSLFIENNQLNSLKYVFEYGAGDSQDIENIPFSMELENGAKRPATRGEIGDYYTRMNKSSMNAKTFTTIADYGRYIENVFKIVPSEWRKVAVINSGEGNVDEFFNKCKTTEQLLNNLLIPVVEEAIEGDNTAQFVETFEHQREHFKKNRVLQDKIEQSRLVKEQIDGYVEVFTEYEEERSGFEDIKREAKTLANYVSNQIEHKEQEGHFNEAGRVAIEREFHLFKHKELSYEWLLKKEALKKLEEAYQKIEEQLMDQQGVYDQFAKRKQNIELSRLAEDIKTAKEQVDRMSEELATIDDRVQIQDIKSLLEENACWIKGYYTYELELIEREQERLAEDLSQSDRDYDKSKEGYNNALKYEKELISKKSQLAAKVELLQNEVDRMMEGLFEEEEIKAPGLLIERIEEKSANLKKQVLELESEILERERQIESFQQSIINNDRARNEARAALQSVRERMEKLQENQSELKALLEKAGYHSYLSGNIYGKEDSLISELEEHQEIAYNRKERALLEERRRYGLIDLYGEMDQFTLEPLLKTMVTELKDKTTFIASGMTHLLTVKESMQMSDETLFERFPYWSMSIICSISDEELVKTYIKTRSELLTNHIVVITIEGLNKVLKGKQSAVSSSLFVIYPQIWADNMNRDKFALWQESLKSEAQGYQDDRKTKEQALLEASHLLAVAKKYYGNYTYEAYKGIVSEINDTEKALEQLELVGQSVEMELKKGQALIQRKNTEKVLAERSLIELSQVLEQAIELKEKEAQFITADQELNKIEMIYLEAVEGLEVLASETASILERRQLIRDEQFRYLREHDRIKDLEIYSDVSKFEAVGTTTGIETLREQRSSLQKKLIGVGSSRNELEERIKQMASLLKRYEHDYAQKQKEATYKIEQIEVHYEGETERLYETLREIKSDMSEVMKKKKIKENAVTELRTRCQILKEKCESDFYGVYQFDVDSSYIENKLKSEKATLRDRERKISIEKAEIEKSFKDLKNVEQELLIKDGAYSFMLESVQPLRLSADYYEDFDLNPESVVSQLMHQMEDQRKMAHEMYGKVQEKQEALMDYCKETIHDLRLRDTVLKGIHHKNTYSELLVYQEKMTEIIMKIIQVAEDDKRESDIELQTFLSHLLSYIKNVSRELDAIQLKTRIQVEDVTKQIFLFDIPEWGEDEAKILLRTYVDETIEYYEKESLHEEVDEVVLRQHVEERLSVKNLLMVVMGDQSIKIKCRKVTNDMKITKAPVVWESSNKWSGGEKWSKNMTLFLSILNYLAEKKQHLSASEKRQRSVILDNPFGKASSDHVLKPVFMIAQKLGFQIIALTAHAEGKFISEYFPVVYSCRLRQTKDQSKQLMTNERTLNYAYLKEHSPMTIMRMQEVEQLKLFD